MTGPTFDGGSPSGLPPVPSGLSTTATILLLAGNQLQEATGRLWPPAKLVPYLNLGVLEIINLKPEASPTTSTISLVAGAKQSLPAGAFALLDAVCNLDAATGLVLGPAITSIEKDRMDHLLPGWTVSPASDIVSFVVTDDRTPAAFYVYPPQPVAPNPSNKIQVIISTAPAEIAETDGTFPLDDSYKPAAVDYVVYRCLAEETTIQNAQAKATSFYQKFLQDLGIKTQAETKTRQQGV